MMTGSPHLKAIVKILEKNSSENEKAAAGCSLGHRTHKSCTGCSLDSVAGSCSCSKKGTETGSVENWAHLKATVRILEKNSSWKAAAGSTLGHRTRMSCTGCSLDIAAGNCSCGMGTEIDSVENWPLVMIPTGLGSHWLWLKAGLPRWRMKASGKFLDHRSCTGKCLDIAAGSCR